MYQNGEVEKIHVRRVYISILVNLLFCLFCLYMDIIFLFSVFFSHGCLFRMSKTFNLFCVFAFSCNLVINYSRFEVLLLVLVVHNNVFEKGCNIIYLPTYLPTPPPPPPPPPHATLLNISKILKDDSCSDGLEI